MRCWIAVASLRRSAVGCVRRKSDRAMGSLPFFGANWLNVRRP